MRTRQNAIGRKTRFCLFLLVAVMLTPFPTKAQELSPISLTVDERDVEFTTGWSESTYKMKRSGTIGIQYTGHTAWLFDIADARNPKFLRQVSFPNFVRHGVFAKQFMFYPRQVPDQPSHWEVMQVFGTAVSERIDILPDNVKSLAAWHGNYRAPWLYLACQDDGVAIVDFEDPDFTTLSSLIGVEQFFPEHEVVPNAFIQDVDLTENGFLAVLGVHTPESITELIGLRSGTSFCGTIDIRDPNNPRVVRYIELESYSVLGRITTHGNSIFITVDGGLDILGVADDGQIEKLSEIIPGERGDGYALYDPGIHENTLYSEYINGANISLSHKRVYDISDIRNPRFLPDHPLSFSPFSGVINFVADDALYESSLVRDLTKEDAPELTELPMQGPVWTRLGGEGSATQVQSLTNDVFLYSFSQPAEPAPLSTTKDTGVDLPPYQSLLNSNAANFGNYMLFGKAIFDITDPAVFHETVRELQIQLPSSDAGTVAQDSIEVRQHFAHGDGLYVLAEAREADSTAPYLISYAIGEQEPLSQVAAITLKTAPEVAALGDRYLVIGSGERATPAEAGSGQVAVYDIAEVTSPRLHAIVETGAVDAVAVDRNRVYVEVIGDVGNQNIFAYEILEGSSVPEENITQLPYFISLDEAFAEYSEEDPEPDRPSQGVDLQASETYLFAREGVLYGVFRQDLSRSSDNTIVSAFFVDPFDDSISYSHLATMLPGPIRDAALWEDRITLAHWAWGMTVYKVPLSQPDPDNEPRVIRSGTTVQGSLAFSGEVDTYRFNGSPEQFVTVTVESLEGSTLDPIVELTNGPGKLLAVNDDGPIPPHARITHKLPSIASGDFNTPFYIRVTAPGGPPRRTVGDYRMTLTPGEAPPIEPPVLPPIISEEDYALSTIQKVRRTNGAPVTFTVTCIANPERVATEWTAELEVEFLDSEDALLFETPVIDPPDGVVRFPGAATVTFIPNEKFANPGRSRSRADVVIHARLVVADLPDVYLTKTFPIRIDMLKFGQNLGELQVNSDTVLSDPVQIFISTPSDLTESQVGDKVTIYGRITPNPDVGTVDVSLNIDEAGIRREFDSIVNDSSGLFDAEFEIREEDELTSGDWQIQAQFDTSQSSISPASGISPILRIPVGHAAPVSGKTSGAQERQADKVIPGVGRSIVAFGPAPNAVVESGWSATQQELVEILRGRRFTESTLRAYNAVEGSPVSSAELAAGLALSSDTDLYTVILAGPNDPDAPGSVRISDTETVTPNDIGTWMQTRHLVLTGSGREGKTVFIVEAPQSGIIRQQMVQDGFSNFVDGPDGYVLTSTGPGEYSLSLSGVSLESGEFVSYTRFLADAIAKGLSLGRAHEQATSSLTRLQGPLVLQFPQPIPAQMPTGMHDIFLGSTMHQGGISMLQDRNAPLVIETSEDQTHLYGESPTLFVEAQDESGYDRVTETFDSSNLTAFAVITTPVGNDDSLRQTTVELPYDAPSGRHRFTLEDFPRAQFGADAPSGGYAVGFYIKDPAENLSTVSSLTLTVKPSTPILNWTKF